MRVCVCVCKIKMCVRKIRGVGEVCNSDVANTEFENLTSLTTVSYTFLDMVHSVKDSHNWDLNIWESLLITIM